MWSVLKWKQSRYLSLNSYWLFFECEGKQRDALEQNRGRVDNPVWRASGGPAVNTASKVLKR